MEKDIMDKLGQLCLNNQHRVIESLKAQVIEEK